MPWCRFYSLVKAVCLNPTPTCVPNFLLISDSFYPVLDPPLDPQSRTHRRRRRCTLPPHPPHPNRFQIALGEDDGDESDDKSAQEFVHQKYYKLASSGAASAAARGAAPDLLNI